MTIKRLIGSSPSQVSRNRDLGSMAFQSKENVQIGNIGAATDVVTLGNGQVTKDASGNLGLGVTPSAWSAGVLSLDMNTIGGFAAGSTSTNVITNAYYNSNWLYKTSNYAAKFTITTSGQHQWFTAPSGTAGNAITFTQAMTLDASSNLTLRQPSSGTTDISFAIASGTVIQRIRYDDSDGSLIVGGGNATAYPLKFYGGNTERMRIDSSGYVGIGTSTTSGGQLTVKASAGQGIPILVSSADATANPQIVFEGTKRYQIGTGNASSGFVNSLYVYDGTAGATRMLIDSSGNVGIGTSIPISGKGLTIGNDGTSGATVGLSFSTTYTDRASITMTGSNGQMAFVSGYAGYGGFQTFHTNGAERMRIDTSGNVGIGTSSPSNKLEIKGGNGNQLVLDNAGETYTQQYFRNNGNNQAAIWATTSDFSLYTYSTQPIKFWTNATERMRIDSSGNLLVGTTSASASNSNSIYFAPSGGAFVGQHLSGTATGTGYAFFVYNAATIGSITQNGTTAVAYNTSSDYRLKENIQPMQNALGVVAQLNPVTYTWKADGSDGQGFIAHELQAVVPDCVTGEKDAVDAEGNPVYQGIDTSFLVATLTKAIQELKAELDATKAEVAALKGK